MKPTKRILSALLCVLLAVTAVCAGSFTAFADTFFEQGDFRFAVTSGDKLLVAGYFGDSAEVVLPEAVDGKSVTGVYKHCFENTNIISVAIPEGYTAIGDFAFCNCPQLASVQVPSTLANIGAMAFSDCTALQSVDLSGENLVTISFAAFNNCQALETAVLGKNVTTLGENAFCNCISLQALTLPAGLTEIPEYAFYNCPLAEVYIPETVTFIGEEAFAPANAIIAFEGTAAAEYAQNSGTENARILKKIMGDVDLDGFVNVNDVTALQRIIAELEPVTAWQKVVSDVDGSGTVSVDDATLIQQYLAEYNVEFVQ